ncbi:hypothetical protein T03_1570 [Trichinella britovi]|uniref:Reverse transcriptase n=1 Tax=Trichinella britovi TaxID=45882 RepID=A0A0V1DFN3_TRIBR|nr:hypothetical protein T03_1570 [Trichinella britovi]
MQQGNIPYRKSHAVALVRAESPQPELIAHSRVREAVEKMTLAVILRDFTDVLSTLDEDLRRTRVIRHAIQTGDAKPVRCFPRRILYYQQVDEMLRRDAVELSSSHWASPIILVKKDES